MENETTLLTAAKLPFATDEAFWQLFRKATEKRYLAQQSPAQALKVLNEYIDKTIKGRTLISIIDNSIHDLNQEFERVGGEWVGRGDLSDAWDVIETLEEIGKSNLGDVEEECRQAARTLVEIADDSGEVTEIDDCFVGEQTFLGELLEELKKLESSHEDDDARELQPDELVPEQQP